MSEFLYGINPVSEAIKAGRRTIHGIYAAQGTEQNPRMRKLVSDAKYRGIPVSWRNRSEIGEASGTRENQGVVADCEPFQYTPYADILGAPRMVLLDNIEDPHNIGAIMRTSEVLGWQNVLLPRRGTALVLPSVAKTAAGACEYLNIACNCSSNQYVKIALDEGYTVVALDGDGKTSLEELSANRPEKLLLVVGGEDSGVGQFIKMNATYVCAISQKGHVNSLNASVAAALALYALR
ncbi:MAG: RNA methyltransferase [Lentisphaeria bacterium]|nr:RNA methyltransferase [Lentisphaeria bacterium]